MGRQAMRSARIMLFVGGIGVVLLAHAGRAASEPGLAGIAMQDSETIHACYTPAGTMYLIMQPGLKQQCSGNHVEITWNVQGPKGDQGDPGQDGVLGYEVVEATSPGDVGFVACPPGKRALGGGFEAGVGANVVTSRPSASMGQEGATWLSVTDLSPEPITSFVVCAFVNE